MDHLDRLAKTALETIASGYYGEALAAPSCPPSFSSVIQSAQGMSLIAEVKPTSPAGGQLLGKRAPKGLADAFAAAGASGLSVLVEPVHFGGSLDTLRHAAEIGIPVLFKDFVLSVEQLDAAACCGASGVLLILALFERGYAKTSLSQMIEATCQRDLEVLLEVYDAEEYARALDTSATMIGINNRDLKTLKVDLHTTAHILKNQPKDRLVWSLSGVNTPEDIDFLKDCDADACLVGTSLMKAKQPETLLKDLLAASTQHWSA